MRSLSLRFTLALALAVMPLSLSAQLSAGSRLIALSQGAEGLPSGIQLQASFYASAEALLFNFLSLEAGIGYHALGPAFPMGGLVSWRASGGVELFAGIGYRASFGSGMSLGVSAEPFARVLGYPGSGIIYGELGIRFAPELILSSFKEAPWLELALGAPIEYAQNAYSRKIGAGLSVSARVDFFKIKRSGL